ncbi:magnesium-dependent phosphatase-1 [Multifurca ochricompacta]|uniref:Magnesium-dependent phosphatase-1 n=1 Tax=Multifurca ochricompacta TaxID=376703 RepID=A0AAD4LUW7_9AGAM|nr:magnesium-dependent phosphatase-1 [Multifurca ochricompacta]
MATSRLPKLVAFDLDYTLWPLWIDSHVSSPLERDGDTLNEVHDKYGDTVAFYHEVPQILHRLRAAGVVIAACSRTTATVLARRALALLLLPPKAGNPESPAMPAIGFFDQLEIYPGSKITHFKQLHKKTGIPYSEMLFFDDELRNRNVESLGVTFHLVSRGVNNTCFERGLESWRAKHLEKVLDALPDAAT